MGSGERVESADGSATSSFREFRNKNVFTPWGLSGELTERQFKAIRFLDKELSVYPWYQGLSVFGSTMFGYGHTTDDDVSDVDIIPMCSKKYDPNVYAELMKAERRLTQEAKERFGVEVSIQDLADVSRMHDTLLPGRTIYASDVNVYAMEALSYWVTQVGTSRKPGRAGIWRRKYRELCSTLTPQLRTGLKQKLLTTLHDRDLNREAKMEKRIPGYRDATQSEKDKTRRQRLRMWENRINELFGL